ncbi:MAG TPA: ABC transporter ATP-binding protein [Actinomycetes bacterium]|nr:ABC transporter ATP-binding protein [Actinomycetes bacterium]
MLATLLRPRIGRLTALAAVLAASAALPLAGPQLVGAFIDRAVAGSPPRVLAALALAYVAVALASQALAVSTTYAADRLAWTAGNRLRNRLARHVLGLDLAFFGRHPPGELIDRVDGDVTALSGFVSSFVLRVAGSVLTLAGVLVAVALEDPRIALALAAFVLLAAVILARSRSRAVAYAVRERAAFADLLGGVEERLDGAEDLRANGGGAHGLRRFREATRTLVRANRRSERAAAGIYVTTSALFAAGSVASLGLGVWRYRSGAITLGTVYLLFRYTDLLRRPLEQIADELHKVQDAVAGAARAGGLLATGSAIGDGGRTALPGGALAVELERVGFAYGDGVPALRDVSLSLAPGAVLGVVGRTGSGKTTLGRLLVRLLDPLEGSVRLGGVDLRDTPLAQVRARVALVPQDVRLFQASLRDNLTLFGAHPADDERLAAVLDGMGLATWWGALDRGLDTPLGTGGAGASAGEAQLIAFARVFLRDPGVVVLDEAASRVDPESAARIERSVGTLLAGRTAVVIAHRLDTVERADEVLVLDGGRVAEHGPRAALAADPCSRYARLLAIGARSVIASGRTR